VYQGVPNMDIHMIRSCYLSRVLPGGLARMEIVLFKTVRFETTPISVLNCNTSTQVASTGNLPPPFHTLAYNPYRLPEMDLAFRRRFFDKFRKCLYCYLAHSNGRRDELNLVGTVSLLNSPENKCNLCSEKP
jgi:hypothetical protein